MILATREYFHCRLSGIATVHFHGDNDDIFYRIREVHSPQNVATYGWVDFHFCKLSLRELPGLFRMYSGTASLPIVCNSAPAKRARSCACLP